MATENEQQSPSNISSEFFTCVDEVTPSTESQSPDQLEEMKMVDKQHSTRNSTSSKLFTCVETVTPSMEIQSPDQSDEMAMENEQHSTWDSTSCEGGTRAEEIEPSTASLVFSKAFLEYQSEDIEVLRQIGEGGQGTIYEVRVNIAAKVGGENPKYETCAAKVFSKGGYGQWPEHVNGLADYYGSFVCRFNGYCQKFKGSPKIEEKDSFCLIMKKYDCSLRNVIDEEKKKDNYSGRPFKTGVALGMILQIAVGMEIVHRENLLHGDLKCDNIFVYKDAGDNMPWGAYIGDFDTGGNVQGTLFWRAPEVMEALDKGLSRILTPMADAYGFGMVCYEILTGDIPLKSLADKEGYGKVRKSVYTEGLRPELPADLHPKIKDLIVRCWNQDPLQRPSFTAIVTELRTILKPYPEFRVLLECFDKIRNMIPLVGKPTPEECLSKLELRLEELRLTYPADLFGYQPGDVDFVKTGYQFLKSLKKFVLKFGYKPFVDHPTLRWSMWFEREALLAKCVRLSTEFDNALPYFDEVLQLAALRCFILDNLLKGKEASSACADEGISEDEMMARMRAWSEKVAKLPPSLDRHSGCVQKNNYGEFEGDKDYPICDFCKDDRTSQLKLENAEIQTFYLFHPEYARITSLFVKLLRG